MSIKEVLKIVLIIFLFSWFVVINQTVERHDKIIEQQQSLMCMKYPEHFKC